MIAGEVEGAGLVPWAGGPPDASFGVLPKRSIPKPDQHSKRYDTTRVVRHRYVIATDGQQLHKISH